jgi:magnesium chelatase subunit D
LSAAFPFSAVVGQEQLKLALLLNAVEPAVGGVLLRGQKGSGKTTLARGLASLLPGGAPFVELPLGATEDRVLGTIDLKAALREGSRRLVPGLLHEAHGGVLYVDEVNLLPDHLVDVLLDVAASGTNRVEREGLSEVHQSRFVLVGSMNPEEGELRPQLLDRFGLAVEVAASSDPGERALAVRRRLAFEEDPVSFAREWERDESALRARLAELSDRRAPGLASAAGVVDAASRLCVELGAEGLRADVVICRAAAALASWEGRREAGLEDVRRVAGLALYHRRRRTPFEEPGIDQAAVDEALARVEGAGTGSGGRERSGGGACDVEEPLRRDEGPAGGARGDSATEGGGGGPSVGGGPSRGDEAAPPAAGPGDARPVRGLGPGARGRGTPAPGRRGPEPSPRGRTVGERVPEAAPSSVAAAATVVAAAARQAAEGMPSGAPVSVREEDVREPVREQRAANLVVLAVDASGSMAARRRVEAARTAVVSLLLDAYQRRDRIAMVTFRGEGAEVTLRPTGSVEVARARLECLETGGRTPLAAGIEAAAALAESSLGGAYRPLLVLLSDGRATHAPGGLDPIDASLEAAARVRRRGLNSVVLDAEEGPARIGAGLELARAMGARHVPLSDLSGQALAHAVRESLT